jgi:hypothetical protein
MRHQQLDDGGAIEAGGDHQRGLAEPFLLGIDIGPGFDEPRHGFGAAGSCRQHQRGGASRRRGICICTCREQCRNDLGVTRLARHQAAA